MWNDRHDPALTVPGLPSAPLMGPPTASLRTALMICLTAAHTEAQKYLAQSHTAGASGAGLSLGWVQPQRLSQQPPPLLTTA